jgi:hypothetical protein
VNESESELVHVERQVFARHVMVTAYDAALEQLPKRFNRLRVNVNGSGHVLQYPPPKALRWL